MAGSDTQSQGSWLNLPVSDFFGFPLGLLVSRNSEGDSTSGYKYSRTLLEALLNDQTWANGTFAICLLQVVLLLHHN